MSIGNILKKIREEKGLTQEQFADKIGVKRTTYISYETSKTNPEFPLILKISSLFDIPIEEFLENEIHPKLSVLHAPEVIYTPDGGNNSGTASLSSEEKLIVAYYRCLEENEKEKFFSDIKNDYLDRRCGIKDDE